MLGKPFLSRAVPLKGHLEENSPNCVDKTRCSTNGCNTPSAYVEKSGEDADCWVGLSVSIRFAVFCYLGSYCDVWASGRTVNSGAHEDMRQLLVLSPATAFSKAFHDREATDIFPFRGQ